MYIKANFQLYDEAHASIERNRHSYGCLKTDTTIQMPKHLFKTKGYDHFFLLSMWYNLSKFVQKWRKINLLKIRIQYRQMTPHTTCFIHRHDTGSGGFINSFYLGSDYNVIFCYIAKLFFFLIGGVKLK